MKHFSHGVFWPYLLILLLTANVYAEDTWSAYRSGADKAFQDGEFTIAGKLYLDSLKAADNFYQNREKILKGALQDTSEESVRKLQVADLDSQISLLAKTFNENRQVYLLYPPNSADGIMQYYDTQDELNAKLQYLENVAIQLSKENLKGLEERNKAAKVDMQSAKTALELSETGINKVLEILETKKQFPEAEDLFNQFLNYLKSTSTNEHKEQLGRTLVAFGSLQMRLQKHPAAEQQFQQALSIFAARLNVPAYPPKEIDISKVYIMLGDIYDKTGKKILALQSRNRAIEDLKKALYAEDSFSAAGKRNINLLKIELAKAYRKNNNLPAAQKIEAELSQP